ncbi:MAG TPA: hypothetical protein VJ962_07075 [Clostridia bacterium]|nr:hypothetical protein [Clostridia bacterium]
MYKLSEIAENFNVERTEIIEALIDHRTLLDDHVEKKMGITYVDDRGIEILYKLLIEPLKVKENKDKPLKKNRISKYNTEEFKDYINIEEKLRLNITELKNDILALDTEIQKKDKFLIDYQEKLLEINRLLVKYEENLLLDNL